MTHKRSGEVYRKEYDDLADALNSSFYGRGRGDKYMASLEAARIFELSSM